MNVTSALTGAQQLAAPWVEPSSDPGPYKGLEPYSEKDQEFFFGRERDVRVIVSNLHATPLTVLYGASGVGKSSVLMAGVVPHLRDEQKCPVVVFRSWQGQDARQLLKEQTLQAVADVIGETPKWAAELASLPLDQLLLRCSEAVDEPMFLILDQFEEYLLYHPASKDKTSFDADIARAVNHRENNANFLISMREDGLSRLDRFQGRIPNLLGNLLRLDRLTLDAARDAIFKPLDAYNLRLPPGRPRVTIETELAEAVIDEVQTGRVVLGQTGRGRVAPSAVTAGLRDAARTAPPDPAARIETPFLQMVLTRLWDEEILRGGSMVLRRATLSKLGGAKRIVQDHLAGLMGALHADERDLAANAFRQLVTPSGTKIAHTAADLAKLTGADEQRVAGLLTRLSSGPARVVRAVPPTADHPEGTRFEIFHDVLAAAVLEWGSRHVADREKAEATRKAEQELAARERELQQARALAEERRRSAQRLRSLVVVTLVAAIIIVVAMGFMMRAQRTAAVARANELEQRNAAEEAKAAAAEAQKAAAEAEVARKAAEAAAEANRQAVAKAQAAMEEADQKRAEEDKANRVYVEKLQGELDTARQRIEELGTTSAGAKKQSEAYLRQAQTAMEELKRAKVEAESIQAAAERAQRLAHKANAEAEEARRIAEHQAQLRAAAEARAKEAEARRDSADRNDRTQRQRGRRDGGGGGCFPAGTMIRTPRGSVAIERLTPGEPVIAVDPAGRAVPATIKSTFRTRSSLLKLRTERRQILTTAEHPIRLARGGFKAAGELSPGDRVLIWINDRPDPDVVLGRQAIDESTQVFNLEVDGPHTFVADDVVVHNKSAKQTDD